MQADYKELCSILYLWHAYYEYLIYTRVH